MKKTARAFWIHEGDDHSIVADDKENACRIVSRLVPGTLEGFSMTCPKTSDERRSELLAMCAGLPA